MTNAEIDAAFGKVEAGKSYLLTGDFLIMLRMLFKRTNPTPGAGGVTISDLGEQGGSRINAGNSLNIPAPPTDGVYWLWIGPLPADNPPYAANSFVPQWVGPRPTVEGEDNNYMPITNEDVDGKLTAGWVKTRTECP